MDSVREGEGGKIWENGSVAKDMIFWNTAIMVENAAKDMNRKNMVPHILPPAMWLNTFGRVMKIKDGPAVDSI